MLYFPLSILLMILFLSCFYLAMKLLGFTAALLLYTWSVSEAEITNLRPDHSDLPGTAY